MRITAHNSPRSPILSKKEFGLTLIELLITVTIIGIMAGLVLVIINPETLRAKARDSKRVGYIKSIQTALELYYADNHMYPPLTPTFWIAIDGTSDTLSSALLPNATTGKGYIESIPTDPLSPANLSTDPCINIISKIQPHTAYASVMPVIAPYGFNYLSNSTGSFYVLTAQLEIASSNKSVCSNLTLISSFPGGVCANPRCYGVENKVL